MRSMTLIDFPYLVLTGAFLSTFCMNLRRYYRTWINAVGIAPEHEIVVAYGFHADVGLTCQSFPFFALLCRKVYASVRRYKSPDEHPFCTNLPSPTMPGVLEYPKTIIPNSVNINDKIWDSYTRTILPQICEPGDDGNYGSSCTCDVACLQAISKRIHYGKFIAESKFLEAPDIYSKYIRKEDRRAIWNELSNFKVVIVIHSPADKRHTPCVMTWNPNRFGRCGFRLHRRSKSSSSKEYSTRPARMSKTSPTTGRWRHIKSSLKHS
mmetsp:Transcript_7214/g.10752  ORF Transcript_7214/g.10752 Transcript_7214/m.10752 type:complete len:266 (+) Transcript_7214:361-1158(+)